MNYVGKEVEIEKKYDLGKIGRGMVVDQDENYIYFASNDRAYSGGYNDKAEGTKYSYCWMLTTDRTNITIIEANLMPELKAGMIIELESGEFKIVLPSSDDLLLYNSELGGGSSIDSSDIVGIYYKNSIYTYKGMFEARNIKDELKLIWSRTEPKTAEELKIEELEKTVESALDQIKEIKGEK